MLKLLLIFIVAALAVGSTSRAMNCTKGRGSDTECSARPSGRPIEARESTNPDEEWSILFGRYYATYDDLQSCESFQEHRRRVAHFPEATRGSRKMLFRRVRTDTRD